MKVDKAGFTSVKDLNLNKKPTEKNDAIKNVNEKFASPLNSAKVKLSERAKDMQKIRQAVDNTPDVNEARIKELRNMIAKGEYKVNPRAVADRMVDEFAYSDVVDKEE